MPMKNLLALPLGIAGTSIGLGIMGEAFDSEGLIDAGETTAGFIAPAITISMGGTLIKQLRDLEKEVQAKSKKKENKDFDFTI